MSGRLCLNRGSLQGQSLESLNSTITITQKMMTQNHSKTDNIDTTQIKLYHTVSGPPKAASLLVLPIKCGLSVCACGQITFLSGHNSGQISRLFGHNANLHTISVPQEGYKTGSNRQNDHSSPIQISLPHAPVNALSLLPAATAPVHSTQASSASAQDAGQRARASQATSWAGF
jgi:hypothetical protein